MVTHVHTTTRSGRVFVALAVLWGMIGLSGAGSWAGDSESPRATLRGLQGVHVIVEALEPEVERYRLTKQQIQADVELQLRKAGIPVFTHEEALRAPGQPLLFISVDVTLRPDGLASYMILVRFIQRASIDINAVSALVTTWDSGGFGTVGVRNLNTLRNSARDDVDRFINAYLSVNPRPAGSAAPASASPRRDLVRQAQERLQAVGFNPGTIDGSMGPQTQNALRWFQNTKGLAASGDLDERTLDALGVR